MDFGDYWTMKGKPTPGKFSLNLYPQHQGQVTVDNSDVVRKWICAHRGWFKSTYLVDKALGYLLQGDNVGWYAPTHKHLGNNYNQILEVVGNDKDQWFNKSEHTFTLPGTEAKIYFFAVNAEKGDDARGWTFKHGIGDEMGEWDNGIWESAIEPCMTKYIDLDHPGRGGDFTGAGTPNTSNPQNDFFVQLMDAENYPETHQSWIIPARGGDMVGEELVLHIHPNDNLSNPIAPFYSDQAMLDSYKRAQSKARWRIEYLCHFLADNAGQFSEESVNQTCILPFTTLETYDINGDSGKWIGNGYGDTNKGWFQTGVDVGITRDFTIVSVINRLNNEMVYFHRFRPGSNSEWHKVYEAFGEAQQRFPGEVRPDCTGYGSHLVEELPRIGVTPTQWGGGSSGMMFTSANKVPIMDHLSTLMNGTVKFFNLNCIKKELRMCQRTITNSGATVIHSPKGDKNAHDDVPCSLALMVMNIPPQVQSYSNFQMEDYISTNRSWWMEDKW